MSSHDLEKFIAGFERFQRHYYGQDNSLIEELAQGQRARSCTRQPGERAPGRGLNA